MQLSALFFLSAGLTGALASAIGDKLIARGDGNVEFCTDVNAQGNCQVFEFTNGACHSFVPNDAFNDQVSTFIPDIGVQCTVFQDTGCSGTTLALGFPGSDDLRAQSFNDEMSSFICNQVSAGGP
ncbi:hypothetical protein B0H12DRAFT_1242722 [Mycena haematopus]|nr:hypothetical protein B0H12DRAFT_1242722 [Mycena haematopus]